MDNMVRPVFRMTDARHAQHLIGLLPVPVNQIPVTDDGILFQARPDIFRLDKIKEPLFIIFIHISVRISGKGFFKRKGFAFLQCVFHFQVRPVADAAVRIQFHIIDAAVIRRKGRDHPILLHPFLFLFQQLFLQDDPLLQLFLLHAVFRIGFLLFQGKLRRTAHLPKQKGE